MILELANNWEIGQIIKKHQIIVQKDMQDLKYLNLTRNICQKNLTFGLWDVHYMNCFGKSSLGKNLLILIIISMKWQIMIFMIIGKKRKYLMYPHYNNSQDLMKWLNYAYSMNLKIGLMRKIYYWSFNNFIPKFPKWNDYISFIY